MRRANIEAGWYQDERHPGFERYWNGSVWTDQTRQINQTHNADLTPKFSLAKVAAAAVGGIVLVAAAVGNTSDPQASSTPAPVSETQQSADVAIGDEAPESLASTQDVRADREAEPVEVAILPADLEYSIEEDEASGNAVTGRRSYDVVLNQRLSEAQLGELGTQLRAEHNPDTTKPTAISYTLADARPDQGQWGRTHFRPELEVVISGFTPAQLEQIAAAPLPAAADQIVGVWMLEQEYLPGRMTIWEDAGGDFHTEYLHADGSSGVDPLAASSHELGQRFDAVPDRGLGEFYAIDPDGRLLFVDAEGIWLKTDPN